MRALGLSLSVLALAACGKPNNNANLTRISVSGPTQQASAEECSAQILATDTSPATVESCPFIQQDHNIRTNGSALAEVTPYYDASGNQVGQFTHACERWLLGNDANGVEIFVDRLSGDVVSHGLVHPGEPTSTLSTPLLLPIQTR
jgi:hypothetical protein